MGPDRNHHLFKLYGESSVPELTWEAERRQRAEATLAELSVELNEYPVKVPLTEATLPAKLHVLSRLSYDPVGVAGLNPMEYIGLNQSGASIEAFAGPSHDRFDDPRTGLPIKTRAILIIPSNHFSSEAAELEFFGLNQYAESDTPPQEPAEEALNFNVPHPNESKKLIIPKGKPVRGITNVFAIRHKNFGTVRLYGLTTKVTPLPSMEGIDRSTEGEITFATRNNVGITLRELRGEEFDETINEFSLALSAVKMSQDLDPANTTMSAEERAALQSISNSASLAETFSDQ